MPNSSFVSTTIPYVNARPHLGHALEYVEADAYARHMAAMGNDVYLLSGSDENSLKNVLAAEKEGIAVHELVGRNVVYFEQLIKDLQVHPNRFIRTSLDPDHIDGAIRIWRLMAAKGDIYGKEYSGLYCVGCEQFYTPGELVHGKCPEHFTVPELVSEWNYFFRLSRYQDRLLDALESGAVKIVPQTRYNEVVSFIKSGLADISISRSMKRARGWGIPVPDNGAQVMYVWIDALTNYINALGWDRDSEIYEQYWAHAEHRVHVVGKGVVRFHAVYWPAMLLSAGLPLPTEVVVHGYITSAGRKLSKSLGNAIDPSELIQKYGSDAVRYFLLAAVSPFDDGDFSEGMLVKRYNTDLANALGNLVSRVMTMTMRYRAGVVPAAGEVGESEKALSDQVEASVVGSCEAMAKYEHRDALARIWDLVRRANAYVDERAPWQLAKAADAGDHDSAVALDTTLHYLVGVIRTLGVLLLPFLPDAAETILATVGEKLRSMPEAWLDNLPGRTITKPPALFPRLELHP